MLCAALCAVLLSGCLPLVLLSTLLADDTDGSQAKPTAVEAQYGAFGDDALFTMDSSPYFDGRSYTRPDTTAVADAIWANIQALRPDSGREDVLRLTQSVLAEYYAFDTAHTHAMLMREINHCEGLWDDEYTLLDDEYYLVWDSVTAYLDQCVELGWRDDLAKEWPKLFLGWDSIPTTSMIRVLESREADLEDRMTEILDEATTRVGYEQMTYDDIMLINDYDDYNEAVDAWVREHNEALARLYIELVKIRNALAREKGFTSYPEMLFLSEGRDYTPEMVRNLLEMMKEEIYPLMDTLWNDVGFYRPDVSMPIEDFRSKAQSVFAVLSPDMEDAFATLFEGNHCFIGKSGVDEAVSPYVIYMGGYEMPFLMTLYDDDLDGMQTLTHEFGHFYEHLMRRDEFAFPDDISEIHSQAMELLFANHYEMVDRKLGRQMLYDVVLDSIDTLSTTAYLTSLELEIYAMDEALLEVDRLNDIAYEMAIAFGNEVNGEIYNRYGWASNDMLLSSPMREICYTTSMIVALEIWEISLEDEEAALEAYDRLIYTQDIRFLDAVRSAGLTSPFERERIRQIARMIQEQFIDGALEDESWEESWFSRDDRRERALTVFAG